MPKIIDHDFQRREIADAFLRVVADKGPTATTMRNVAREAQCSPSLPMHYFDSRAALIEFAFARQADELVAELSKVAMGNSLAAERLARVIALMIDRSSGDSAAWRTAIATIVKAEQSSVVEMIDRKCYLEHIELLTNLLTEFVAETGKPFDASDEAILLLTSVDGLALATLSLGSKADQSGNALKRIFAKHYGLLSL
jgi:AcrR family transcriptional regulator